MAHSLRQDFRCTKKVEELVASYEGFYCNDCSKSVIDFRGLGKEQIIERLHQSSHATACAIIPITALDYNAHQQNSFWSPFRKSVLLITLFLLVGEIKTLFAQTIRKIKDDTQAKQTPGGYQRIMPSGFIHDHTGKGIANAEIIFFFDGEELGRCHTDEYGSFKYDIENFGGISEIDIKVEAATYKSKMLRQVSILKENPTIKLQMEYESPVVPGDQMSYTVGGITSISFLHYYRSGAAMGARHYGLPLNIFDDITPTPYIYSPYDKPVYVSNLHYPIQVMDKEGSPITNAKIEMHFPKKQYRWATTNQEGKTKLRVQLSKPIFYSKVVVSAEGYHTKMLNDFGLDTNDTRVFVLKKIQHKNRVNETEYINQTECRSAIEQTNGPSEHILVFPNPTSETCTIQLHSLKNASVELVDISGKVLQRKSIFNQPSIVFDVKMLQAGIYIIIIRYDGKTFSERIIISR